ncbi:MAG: hypothetical protein LBS57_01380 [Treponema sp.]|jgi:hypothetical protein|nr:hypothetical protein [Treponema sp.]
MRPSPICAFFLLACLVPVFPQAGRNGGTEDPAALVGLSLEALLNRFGTPQAVYAARGAEEWQDDVVFVYGEGDFYIFKDRVWQVGLKSVRGIKPGDSKPAALLLLGEEAEDRGDHILLSLPDGNWPLTLRVSLNGTGFVSALYIYRPDF